jgi:hypothetical protein
MITRRRALAAAALAAVAGCVGSDDGTDATSSPSDTPGPAGTPTTTPTDATDATATDDTPADDVEDGPTHTPGDVPEWTPEWTLSFDGTNLLGVDAGDDRLYATVSAEDGPSSVAAVDPDAGSARWRTTTDGEPVSGSHVGYQSIARGQWGVTLADDAVYAVAGLADERKWSALSALDRANGDRRWRVRRDRRLAVRGVTDDLVVATGLEFFPGPDETPVSHQTPTEPLSTVVYGFDATDGSERFRRAFTGVVDVTTGGDATYVAAGDRLVGLGPDGTERFALDGDVGAWVEATDERAFYLAGGEAARRNAPGALGPPSGPTRLFGVAPDGTVDWRRRLPVEELLLLGDRLYAAGDVVAAVESDGTVAWVDADNGQWLLPDADGDALYVRSGIAADRATAYGVGGSERWTFDPPSNNAWPETATADAAVVSAIGVGGTDAPFLTVYAVDADGRATAAVGKETVFDAASLGGTAYLADGESRLLAFEP